MGIPAIWAPPDPKSLVKYYNKHREALILLATWFPLVIWGQPRAPTNAHAWCAYDMHYHGARGKRSAVSVVMDASLVSSSVSAMEIEVETTDDTETSTVE